MLEDGCLKTLVFISKCNFRWLYHLRSLVVFLMLLCSQICMPPRTSQQGWNSLHPFRSMLKLASCRLLIMVVYVTRLLSWNLSIQWPQYCCAIYTSTNHGYPFQTMAIIFRTHLQLFIRVFFVMLHSIHSKKCSVIPKRICSLLSLVSISSQGVSLPCSLQPCSLGFKYLQL